MTLSNMDGGLPRHRLAKNRDAWFVIRGYRYQIDLTILRWLDLEGSQCLFLEYGEDIDVVNRTILDQAELEQVKHLDESVTLRAAPCLCALAKAAFHFRTNPSMELVFRFCTNANITTERPSLYADRLPGISVWEGIRLGEIEEDQRRIDRIGGLLVFLRNANKPKKGIDQGSWENFKNFVNAASINELEQFIRRFEWSTGQRSANQASEDVIRCIQKRLSLGYERARQKYAVLFIHVMQVLSESGIKELVAGDEQSVLSGTYQIDESLMAFVEAQVFELSHRVGELEAVTRRNSETIATIQNDLQQRLGTNVSIQLSNAITGLTTELPPTIGHVISRDHAMRKLAKDLEGHNWVAIHGSVGSGKTQLASLLDSTLEVPPVYLSLRDLSEDEAGFLLNELLCQIRGRASDSRQSRSTTQGALEAMGEGTCLVIDDLPQLSRGSSLVRQLSMLSNAVAQRKQVLLTFSHHEIPADTRSAVGSFLGYRIPAFTTEEAVELFVSFGANDDIDVAVVKLLVLTNAGNPTLLTALARKFQANGWHAFSELNPEIIGEAGQSVIEETTVRLLRTVESDASRELLYRLCVIVGSFDNREVKAVSDVEPAITKPNEAYSPLKGLWIEELASDKAQVCPLIAKYGFQELSKPVEQGVASCLADCIFDRGSIFPTDFVRAISYLRRSEDGHKLGTHLWSGLGEISHAPVEWQRYVFDATSALPINEICPLESALLVRARQIQIADTLGEPIGGLLGSAKELMNSAETEQMWAVYGFAAQCTPCVARNNFEEGLELCRLALTHADSALALGLDKFSEDDEIDVYERKSGFPWLVVTEIGSVSDFRLWFDLLVDRSSDDVKNMLDSPMAKEGMKFALDRLCLLQYKLPESKRVIDAVENEYRRVMSIARARGFDLVRVLVERSLMEILAEFRKDVAAARKLADESLSRNAGNEEFEFLIYETIGRQHLYHRQSSEAIQSLTAASTRDTGTFESLRCRALMELSRAIGDGDSNAAKERAIAAVEVAERSPQRVSELDQVIAYGEASIASWFADDRQAAFQYIDKAFTLLIRLEKTNDWKVRFCVLGNALGYMASIASTGKPPSDNYTVPPRGKLLVYSEIVAAYYDNAYAVNIALLPTQLVAFADALERDDRAVFWANSALDTATAKGAIVAIHSLAEALVPDAILRSEYDVAFDYANQAAIALGACYALRNTNWDIRKPQDPLRVLGDKPSDRWNLTELHYLLIGGITAVLHAVNRQDRDSLMVIADRLEREACNASNDTEFLGVSAGIKAYLADASAKSLNEEASSHMKSEEPAAANACYILSSFCDDAHLEIAIVQHVNVAFYYSQRLKPNSGMWRFLANELKSYWQRNFDAERFRFASPALVEEELTKLTTTPYSSRLQRLLRTISRGLSVQLPSGWDDAQAWLRAT